MDDEKNFLRKIFNERDLNRDGSITSIELQEALRGQISNFSLKTIELLISKHDKNGDKEISFEEFNSLFNNLNEEYSYNDKSISISSRSKYSEINNLSTNSIMLIGHTDALQEFEIYRPASMQDAVNVLRADFDSLQLHF